ncbi:HD domain-containing protein [Candidatus Dependentiae bacterium]
MQTVTGDLEKKATEKTKKSSQDDIVQKTAQYVRQKLEGEGSGHDWWHIYRVWKLAKNIGDVEEADLFIVELAALLHDIADWKFTGGDVDVGPKVAREWLASLGVDESDIAHICKIMKDMSFKGAGVSSDMQTREGMVVQDADRLDAIGAVGIGRCFAYGGYKKNMMHDPDLQPVMHNSAQEYITAKTTSINHFYEKLLLLKERMNTATARAVAQERHEFMDIFLEKFLSEWDGRDC